MQTNDILKKNIIPIENSIEYDVKKKEYNQTKVRFCPTLTAPALILGCRPRNVEGT